MNPMLICFVLIASACAGPVPGTVDDKAELQKGWIEDFSKIFQKTITSKSPERATTAPQTFDFKLGYDFLQNLFAKMIAPKPLLDTIQEKEKYGNDGSSHQAIGNAVVKGSETLSKMINAAFEVPKLAAKMVSNSITQALNGLGAKLIGL